MVVRGQLLYFRSLIIYLFVFQTEEPAAAAAVVDAKAEVKEEKPQEPPKDIKEDPIGWLGQQIPPAVHKVGPSVVCSLVGL